MLYPFSASALGALVRCDGFVYREEVSTVDVPLNEKVGPDCHFGDDGMVVRTPPVAPLRETRCIVTVSIRLARDRDTDRTGYVPGYAQRQIRLQN